MVANLNAILYFGRCSYPHRHVQRGQRSCQGRTHSSATTRRAWLTSSSCTHISIHDRVSVFLFAQLVSWNADQSKKPRVCALITCSCSTHVIIAWRKMLHPKLHISLSFKGRHRSRIQGCQARCCVPPRLRVSLHADSDQAKENRPRSWRHMATLDLWKCIHHRVHTAKTWQIALWRLDLIDFF